MFKTLYKSVREFKKSSLLTSFYVVVVVFIEGLIPFVLANLVDNIQNKVPIGLLLKNGLILIFFAFLSLIAGILAGTTGAYASSGFARNLRHDIFDKIQKFSFENIDSFSESSLITRLTTDVNNVQNAYMMLIRVAVRMPLVFIFSISMAFIMAGKLAFIFVVIIPILLIGLGLIIFNARKIFIRVFAKYDKLNNVIQENVKASRLVKSLVRKNYELEKFNNIATDVKDDFTKADRLLAFTSPLFQFCLYMNAILILFFGSYVIINKVNLGFGVGQLSALLTYSFMILNSLMIFSFVLVMITLAGESAKRIVAILEIESSITDEESLHYTINSGKIEYKNVCFKFSEEAIENVINNISFTIESGQSVGIIGATGSGKSSLVQLIPRLYDIQSGEILIDDKKINHIDLERLRDNVGMVLQKNTLFSGTIKENLKWGNENATDEEIDIACKIAQVDEIINKMPEGYETHIEQGGANLSGGQKQRLCIARALIKKPKILIFDDSTSAVDTKTDELIRRGLEDYMPETTKIIISQRILSVQNSDVIFVLDKGNLVKKGIHEDLIKEEGLYRELYMTQNGGIENEK